MSFYKCFHWISMSIGDKGLIIVFLMLRIGFVWLSW